MPDEAPGPPPMPTWAKALVAAVLLIVLGFVVLHFTGAAPVRH